MQLPSYASLRHVIRDADNNINITYGIYYGKCHCGEGAVSYDMLRASYGW
jgi:hypothetical protein